MRIIMVAVLALLTALSAARAQEDVRIVDIREAWAACVNTMEDVDGWYGWRHDFLNGYSNEFAFWDGRWADDVSVLRRGFLIDGIAYDETISCFRPDGSLAFIFTQMTSPNMADGGHGAEIVREGRLYFSEEGEIIRLLGQIADTTGNRLGDIDNQDYMIARGCAPVTVHRRVDTVEIEYFNYLGDIGGEHPDFIAEMFDWCAELTDAAG